MTTQKKAVGIQIMGRGKHGEMVALLQVRAKWNAEKNAPESWPGACQTTAHGKLEAGEDFLQALVREAREELGAETSSLVEKSIKEGKLKELVNHETPEKHIITYGLIAPENILENLLNRPKTASFGGFKAIKKEDVGKIIDIKNVDKVTGVTDENTIAMFPDHIEAVKMAFEKLG